MTGAKSEIVRQCGVARGTVRRSCVETFAGSVSRLKDGGRLVFVGGTSGGELTFSGWDLMRAITLTGYSSETLTRDLLQSALEAIADDAGRGVLRVPAVKAFPLRDAARAHAELEAGDSVGRVVLVPDAAR